VVRIRGNSLRLLRYAEVARPADSHSSVLELLDTEGNCLRDGGVEWKPLTTRLARHAAIPMASEVRDR
jgi:hypothetical protein